MRRTLHVVFLSTGDASMARLAAALARAEACENLEVDAAALRDGSGGIEDGTEGLDRADLVVVIDPRPNPEPIALDHPGGRVDWHLPSLNLEHLAARVWRLLLKLGLNMPGRGMRNASERTSHCSESLALLAPIDRRVSPSRGRNTSGNLPPVAPNLTLSESIRPQPGF